MSAGAAASLSAFFARSLTRSPYSFSGIRTARSTRQFRHFPVRSGRVCLPDRRHVALSTNAITHKKKKGNRRRTTAGRGRRRKTGGHERWGINAVGYEREAGAAKKKGRRASINWADVGGVSCAVVAHLCQYRPSSLVDLS
jgi:hypothetical protein